MRLKRLYAAMALTMALALVLVLAALPFLPETIPVHYNGSGAVDRWGSKCEMLIFPGILLPYGALWLGTCRVSREFGEISERIMAAAGIVQFAVFDFMTAYFLYAGFRRVENLAALPLDLHRLVSGLGLIALGNWMPKLKEPGPVGLRTPWSMKNGTVWRKCQRFGGWSFAAAGACSILAAALAPGAWCWLWTVLALAAAGIAGTVYSRHAAKTAPED